jgi:hypothetical protein
LASNVINSITLTGVLALCILILVVLQIAVNRERFMLCDFVILYVCQCLSPGVASIDAICVLMLSRLFSLFSLHVVFVAFFIRPRWRNRSCSLCFLGTLLSCSLVVSLFLYERVTWTSSKGWTSLHVGIVLLSANTLLRMQYPVIVHTLDPSLVAIGQVSLSHVCVFPHFTHPALSMSTSSQYDVQ